MTSEKKKMSLTTQIMIGMGAGALFGILLNVFADVPGVDEFLVSGLLHAVGAMFIASLQMMVVPLVFVSLVVGVTSMGNIASLGRMSIKPLLLYLFTTAVAVTIALTLAVTASPGEGVEASKEAAEIQVNEAPPATQLLIDMVPTNPVKAMAQGNMLQIIVFAMLFGVAVALAGEKGIQVVELFDDLNEAIMHMVDIIMRLAPYGVFALIGKAFATQGLDLNPAVNCLFFNLDRGGGDPWARNLPAPGAPRGRLEPSQLPAQDARPGHLRLLHGQFGRHHPNHPAQPGIQDGG